jgi:branched-chain amino acid transport system substrate-binding protein
MAAKNKLHFTRQDLARQIHAFAIGTGVMGPFNLDRNGVLYTRSEVKTVEKQQTLTA